ncbi:NAD-dependent epimerase/dehydratase family protein [Leptolyngbya sp. PCC 6406]|uniref:NAD-dependent epimerase/dehydratase family protein n=1 Tax=Leptolyngbya sp. PCC 6406 TaxID=1173264 RepID=UPI0002AC10D3|nr:NAD-dependent epimerase/dehydratase family protein [Leptolyngbya sp. PCC 6406]
MKLFVTGGTGFIGSHFLMLAVQAGHEVLALKRAQSQPRLPLTFQPTWLEGTLTEDWSKALEHCDVLVHLAAAGVNPNFNDWHSLFSVNVSQSLDLWLQAKQAGVKRLVVCGSCSEYGYSGEQYEFIPTTAPLQPTNAYGASKASASLAAMGLAVQMEWEVVLLRPFHVYGQGEAEFRLWPSLRKAALAGADFPMTAGEQIRDFMPVEQVAQQFLHACEMSNIQAGNPMVKNLGTGKPQTVREFSEFWWQHWQATGQLLLGKIPYRSHEVMRYVPKIPRD